MNQNNIEIFIANHGSKFPVEKLIQIKQMLSTVSDDKLNVIQTVEYKDPTMMQIISILIGAIGVDRFMLEDTGKGLLKLFTCGGFGILTIMDWVTITKQTREYNFKQLSKVL